MTEQKFLVSSREGRVCFNGKRIQKQHTQIFEHDHFKTGSLAIPSTLDNIQVVSQVFLDLFITPKGIILPPGEGSGYRTLDIVGRYKNMHDAIYDDHSLLRLFRGLFRSDRNLTRGWCYLAAATLHRFFYQDYDLYRGECEYDSTDFHWWLHNESRGTIDLTEEQYRIMKIYELRKNGTRRSPMGHSYGVKTRNMAVKVAEVLCGSYVDPKMVRVTGYTN